MRKSLWLLFLVLVSTSYKTQSAADLAVQITASVQTNPPQITLSWPGNSTTSQYLVFRKSKMATSWGPSTATLNGTTNQYSDNSVSVGDNYEYRIQRTGNAYLGYGYINCGIAVPEIAHRGKLIIVVDSSFVVPLAQEIDRYVEDVEGDGWEVIRHDVDRSGSVKHVKDLIVNDYALDSAKIKAVFLLGHVPVPYSGNINPDGHPDHLGAWPADVYYGDIDGTWTDISVNSTTASPARTKNVPGDGKFDQSLVPGDVELQVGRVDFNNMPAISASEQLLLKNYLDKDHEYRKKVFSAVKRAVIDDNFGYFSGEAFAAGGYKNYAPLVGPGNINIGDYFTSMTGNSYLWSYGCGGGTYVSAGGIGNTTNFSTSSLEGVFTMLFGSYFGDWDSQDNFLKAPLTQGKILCSVWSGRPHFQFHHMGLGENIGYGLLLTQNNPGGLYFNSTTGITGKWVHNALMGDPTLRNDVVAPVSNVVATKVGDNCVVNWTGTSESNVIGYNLYMKNDSNTSYVKINASPISSTSFTHSCLLQKGIYKYMVRALKLENGFSGSYYNMSEGISDTAYNSNNIAAIASFTSSVTGDQVHFTNTSPVAATYIWDFGNGNSSTSANPIITYTANGTYVVSLIASHPCYVDTTWEAITLAEVGLDERASENSLVIFPNPTTGKTTLSCICHDKTKFLIFDLAGKTILRGEIENSGEVDLSDLVSGMYFVRLSTRGQTYNKKLVKE